MENNSDPKIPINEVNEDEKNNEIQKNAEKNKNQSYEDLIFGLALPGRIIFTLYSLHGFFFIYNIIVQYIIFFPSLLFTETIPKMIQLPFSILYILFAINLSNILVIPTFEFFSFPFLLYREPLSHILSFKYIYENKEFRTEDRRKLNKHCMAIFIFFEIAYFIVLILGYINPNYIIYKDIIKISILFIIYLYYTIIVLNYLLFSLYLIKIFVKNFLEGNFYNIINSHFKDKAKISNVNLFSYIINPHIIKNYKNIEGKELTELDSNYSRFECLMDLLIVNQSDSRFESIILLSK